MYNESPMPRARLLSLLVAVACGGLSATASANPSITLAASYALNGDPIANALLQGSLVTTPTGADFYMNQAVGGSSIFFHAYGNTGGTTYFGARASGEGSNFYGLTSSLYSGSFTNNTGGVVDLNFSFNVDGGEVGLAGSGVGTASTRLQVRRDGAVVSQGETTVTQTAAGYSCTKTDIGVLGGWSSCSSPTAHWAYGAGGAYSVDLGLVGIGQTVGIDYDIVSMVTGQYTGGAVSSGNCYGGYGGYGNVAVTEAVFGGGGGPCTSYNGIARSGDPFNGGRAVNTADFSLTSTAVPLPEPASLALLVAAGGGWWLSRRRRGPAAG